jgi:hypothetical protein
LANIGKLDCTEKACKENSICGFPTSLKFFSRWRELIVDYSGDRTAEAMLEFVKNISRYIFSFDIP